MCTLQIKVVPLEVDKSIIEWKRHEQGPTQKDKQKNKREEWGSQLTVIDHNWAEIEID